MTMTRMKAKGQHTLFISQWCVFTLLLSASSATPPSNPLFIPTCPTYMPSNLHDIEESRVKYIRSPKAV